jgi:hypothetical protein
MHLDRGYDSRKTRDLGYDDEIAVKGIPARSRSGNADRSSAPTHG